MSSLGGLYIVVMGFLVSLVLFLVRCWSVFGVWISRAVRHVRGGEVPGVQG